MGAVRLGQGGTTTPPLMQDTYINPTQWTSTGVSSDQRPESAAAVKRKWHLNHDLTKDGCNRKVATHPEIVTKDPRWVSGLKQGLCFARFVMWIVSHLEGVCQVWGLIEQVRELKWEVGRLRLAIKQIVDRSPGRTD